MTGLYISLAFLSGVVIGFMMFALLNAACDRAEAETLRQMRIIVADFVNYTDPDRADTADKLAELRAFAQIWLPSPRQENQ